MASEAQPRGGNANCLARRLPAREVRDEEHALRHTSRVRVSERSVGRHGLGAHQGGQPCAPTAATNSPRASLAVGLQEHSTHATARTADHRSRACRGWAGQPPSSIAVVHAWRHARCRWVCMFALLGAAQRWRRVGLALDKDRAPWLQALLPCGPPSRPARHVAAKRDGRRANAAWRPEPGQHSAALLGLRAHLAAADARRARYKKRARAAAPAILRNVAGGTRALLHVIASVRHSARGTTSPGQWHG
jgi:hypothetical protein